MCVCVLSCFSHVWLCDPMDCSPPGSSVHEILQAWIVGWVVIPSSRGSSWPWDQTQVPCSSCTAGRFFNAEPPGKPLPQSKHLLILLLQSPSTVILEPKLVKSVTVSTVSPSICHEIMGPDAMSLVLVHSILFYLFFVYPIFFPIYWDIIDIEDCISLRYTA